MRKICCAMLIGASLPLAALSAMPAHAGDGGVAAGIIGGLAAGTLFGIAASSPVYAPPPPVYVAPEPVYVPDCYWTHGRPYWDEYRGAWVYPRVRVCE
jgi:hypothetical protein